MDTGPASLYYIMYIILLIGFILAALSWIDTNCDNKPVTATGDTEGWFNYQRPYFNEHSTGFDVPYGEQTYYTLPVYRKPYRWPLGFKTRHPVEHIQPVLTQGM